MSAIKSLLKEVVKNLPEGSTKAQSVIPQLMKKGVKAEELEFAAMKLPTTGKVSKQQIVDAEAARKDKFYTTETKGYQNISLPAGKDNPTYKMKVLSFNEKGNASKSIAESFTPEQRSTLEAAQQGNADALDDAFDILGDANVQMTGDGEQITDQIILDAIDGALGNTQPSRYTSSHTDVPDYLAHTRIFDEDWDGAPVRVLQEIQSDLHQAGRQRGYAQSTDEIVLTAEQRQTLLAADPDDDDSIDAAQTVIDEVGASQLVDENSFPEALDMLIEGDSAITGVPKSPHEKQWLRKGIERELVDAIEEGRTQLAIPISGEDIGNLVRAPGVQKWYETQVVNTAKKVAKASGSDFEMVTKGGKVGEPVQFKELYSKYMTNVRDMSDHDGIALKSTVQEMGMSEADSNRLVKIFKDVQGASEEDGVFLQGINLAAPGQDGTSYAVIKPKGEFVEGPKDIDHEGVTALYKEMEEDWLGMDLKTIQTRLDEAGVNDPNTAAGLMLKQSNGNTLTTKEAQELSDALKAPKVKGKLDLDKPFSFSLYSSPAAAAGVAYMAYKQGASEEQVTEALEAKGFGMEDVQMQLEFLTQAIDQGASVQEAVKYLETKDTKAKTVEKKPPPPEYDPTKYTAGRGAQPYTARDPQAEEFHALMDENSKMTDEEVLSALETLYPVLSSLTTTDLPSMLNINYPTIDGVTPRQRYDMARMSSRLKIQLAFEEKTGKPLGWETVDGWFGPEDKYTVQNEQGQEVEITPGFLNSLGDTKFETALAFGGALLGSRFGGAPGVLAGGLAGSVTGAEVDYTSAAMRLQLDMDAEAMAWTALNAGEIAVVGEAIMYPVAKVLGYAWKGTAKAVRSALNGDETGAAQALKGTTFLNQDQVDEIISQVKRYMPLEGTKSEQGIQAVAMSQPGMEHVIAASQKYGDAGAQLTETIKRRTTEILGATADLTDEHVPRLLGHDLQNYVADVKQSYNTVKIRATEAPDAKNFKYNFDDLAIMPVLEDTADKIFNPAVRDKFINQMGRVRTLTKTEGFGNLIELRQLTNDFLYNSNITKADDKKMIRGVINNIDEAIKEGAHNVVENPKQWLDDWAAVRSEYSQMKVVEKTSMYKAITDKSGGLRALSPDQVVKRLTKYITALDGSFEAVMEQLPMAGRKLYEGAVIDSLTNKYTMDGTAIHFPQLAKDLAKVNFTTPEARAMKKVLMDLGETFKNDVKIVNASTGMHIPSVMQGLSDNLLVKAKYEIAAGTYAKMRSIVQPSVRHRVDLLQKVGAMIEAPLNQKAAKELLEAADGDVNLTKQVRQLQQEAARAKAAGQDPVTPKIHFYGSGVTKRLKGEGPVTAKIPAHRIATIEKARTIAESEYLTLDSKYLDAALKQHGFQALMQGSESIRVLK